MDFQSRSTRHSVVFDQTTSEQFSTIGDVVARLLKKKMDLVFYESVADAIANSDFARERATKLFGSLAAACANEPSPLFERSQTGIWEFNP